MMNIEEISDILPQKFPFLMLDRVVSVDPGKRVVAFKNVTINEWYFQGHFPGKSIMPGALIIEAMAQGAILLHSSLNNFQLSERANYYLASIKANFLKPVIPGDQLTIDVAMVKPFGKGFCIEAKAFVKEEKVAWSELICAVVK